MGCQNSGGSLPTNSHHGRWLCVHQLSAYRTEKCQLNECLGLIFYSVISVCQ